MAIEFFWLGEPSGADSKPILLWRELMDVTSFSNNSAPSQILVVDDEPGVREFCVRTLRISGYQVASAENGRVALERLAEGTFDLVLTDLQMPELSGIALLHRLRQLYPDTDVIVFTAYGTFETAREALRLGAFDYLTKPVSLDDLERTVRRALEWRRVRQEKQRLSEIVALYEISQTFTSTLDTRVAVREIIGLLWRRFSPRSLSLSLLYPETNELELLAQRGSPYCLPSGTRVATNRSDETAIIEAHSVLVGEEPSTSPGKLISLLLRTNDRSVGLLQLTRGSEQPSFGSDDRTMLAVCASQVAASLENSRLYQQLKQQNLETIEALAAAIEARDPYTSGHSHRVMRYSVRLAEVLGLSEAQIETIRYGALLHDIGKIGIRDHILLKPGKLSDEEMGIMQQHPQIGADILRNIKALSSVVPVVECHHERMDGGGYPSGKIGVELAEEARVIAIADAFDAMTSDRAYRKATTKEQAFTILKDGRDSHWDGVFVDTFITLMGQESAVLMNGPPHPVQAAIGELLDPAV